MYLENKFPCSSMGPLRRDISVPGLSTEPSEAFAGTLSFWLILLPFPPSQMLTSWIHPQQMLLQWSYTVWLSGNLLWYATPPHLSVTVPPCLTLFVISLLLFLPSLFSPFVFLFPRFSALSQALCSFSPLFLFLVFWPAFGCIGNHNCPEMVLSTPWSL